MAYSQDTFPDGNVSANMFDPTKSAPQSTDPNQNTIQQQGQPMLNQNQDPGQPTGGAPPSATSSIQMPAGIDPRLAALYQQNGMTPGGSGSGFADWQYWQDKANSSGDWNYFTDRLGKDLQGTGTDQPTGTPGQGAWSSSGAGGAGGGAGSGSSASSFTTQTTPFEQMNPDWAHYQQSPQDSTLYDMLMGKANQSLKVDPNDPIIANQVNAYRAEQDRGVKNYLSSAAEKGGPNNNMDAAARSANEKAGQATSGMQAQLMQNELNSRRQEIQQALQEQGSLLSQQDQIALQRELGLINSSIQKWGMGNQNQQYYAGLNLGQQQLNSQNDQFASNFGLNSTNQANYWDSIRRGLL